MKIVILNVPGHGHVNPMLAVTAELVRRGHEIIYYNIPEFALQIRQTGAEFRPYPEPNLTSAQLATFAQNLVNVTLFLLQESARLLPFVLNELRREQPDLVLYDSICLWGMQAARLLKLPTAASITTFVQEGVKGIMTVRDFFYIVRHALPRVPRLLRYRRALVKQYGKAIFPEKQIFPVTGDLTLVFSSREFQSQTDFIDGRFQFVGPSIDAIARPASDFPFEQLGTNPLIYISLGTVYSSQQTSFYQQCFTAFADFPAQFVLSVGQLTNLESVGQTPQNFIVRPSVPQLEVLQRADLFISHGGMNSINESLYYGVPLVIVPQQMEQLLNGRMVERAEAGLLLGEKPPYGRIQSHQLRAAATKLLNNSHYKQAAERIGQTFRQAGGFQQAANLIEEMKAVRAPAPPYDLFLLLP